MKTNRLTIKRIWDYLRNCFQASWDLEKKTLRKNWKKKPGSLKKGLGNILNASNAAKEFLKEKTSNDEAFDSDEDDEDEDDEEIPENEYSQDDDEDIPEKEYSQDEDEDDFPEDAVLEEDSKFKKCREIEVPLNIVKIDEAIFSGYSKPGTYCPAQQTENHRRVRIPRV